MTTQAARTEGEMKSDEVAAHGGGTHHPFIGTQYSGRFPSTALFSRFVV